MNAITTKMHLLCSKAESSAATWHLQFVGWATGCPRQVSMARSLCDLWRYINYGNVLHTFGWISEFLSLYSTDILGTSFLHLGLLLLSFTGYGHSCHPANSYQMKSQQPFYSYYTDQPELASLPHSQPVAKTWRILLKHSFTAHMPLHVCDTTHASMVHSD